MNDALSNEHGYLFDDLSSTINQYERCAALEPQNAAWQRVLNVLREKQQYDVAPVVFDVPQQPTGIKVLTVRQPWAWAIFHGKDIENRDWKCHHRGKLAIHAAKGMTLVEYNHAAELIREHATALLPAFDDLVRGSIIGTVEVVDCVASSDSPWFFGEYGLVLRNQKLLDMPIESRGVLGLWTYEGLL